MLEVSSLSVEYAVSASTSGKNAVRAVDDVTFSVEAGEFVGIVGESGCGKSTLLFAIAQLLVPPAEVTGGSVTFAGRSLVGLTDRQLAAVQIGRAHV